MKAICDEIDRNILTLNVNIKAYGLCIPVTKGTQIQPVPVDSDKAVSINDRWDVQFFHRLLNDNIIADEEFSYGAKYKRRHAQIIRTVVIVKKKMGFDWIDCFVNKIPQFLRQSNILEQYEFVNLTEPMAENNDQDVIYKTEFGPDHEQYEKHRMSYIIYAFEYAADYIKCPVVCT